MAMTVQEVDEKARKPERTETRQGPNQQLPALQVRKVEHFFAGGLEREEGLVDPLEECSAGLGEPQTARSAVEEPDRQLILERLDLVGQIARADTQLVGRMPDAAVTRDGREIFQLAEVHGASSRS